MDKVVYTAMGGAKVALRAQGINSHNLANISTGGFRAHLTASEPVPTSGAAKVNVARGRETFDTSNGAMMITGRDLDVALAGEGWLTVEDGRGGEAYTRSGDLRINELGELRNSAGQHVLVVVCDEPASVTDAYAVIKVLSAEHGLRHFKVVTNMTRQPGSGKQLFATLGKVTNRFLDVILEHAADIPDDDLMRRAIREQRPVVEAYPTSPSGTAYRNLASNAASWELPSGARGNIEFFAERLVTTPSRRIQVIK